MLGSSACGENFSKRFMYLNLQLKQFLYSDIKRLEEYVKWKLVGLQYDLLKLLAKDDKFQGVAFWNQQFSWPKLHANLLQYE